MHFKVYICVGDIQGVPPVAYLFLKGAGNQPAQLAQAVVDPVTAPLLNYLRKDKSLVIF